MPLNLKKYFISTSSERKGLVVLIILLGLSFFCFFIEDYIYNSAVPVEETVEEMEDVKQLSTLESKYLKKIQKETPKLFQFNPNDITQEEWERLGFSEKQAISIVKFRSKGFQFRKKSDLKKLYVVDDKKYKQLKPYIVLPIQKIVEEEDYRIQYVVSAQPVYKELELLEQVYYRKEQNKYTYYSKAYKSWKEANAALETIESKGFEGAFITKAKSNFVCYPIHKKDIEKKELVIIEVNTADTTGFKTMKGIGSYYAQKIVAYREKLGGFYSIEQLKEVYGIKPDVIEQNKQRLTIDTAHIVKINLNTVTKEKLREHPYIKWNIANSIVMYRLSHGNYESVQNIQNSDLVNDELYRKIVRYLTVK